MNALHTLPLLLAACVSSTALAGGHWYEDRYESRHDSRYDRRYDDHHARHHHRHHQRNRQVEYIVVERPVYSAPRVVYQEPVVIYRDRVIHEERPVYREAPPRRYYREDAPVRYRDEGMSSGAGQVLGAVAGGIMCSRFGDGNGRLAATAAGAVLGGMVGGELSRD